MNSLKNKISDWIATISPRVFLSIAYYHNRGRCLDLSKPKDLSALWIKKVLAGEINKIYNLADKYEVRKYVDQKGLGSILPSLIGVYDRPEQIQYAKLPNQFALKMNYGAGMNIICREKKQLNISESNNKIKSWLNRPEYNLAERHYNLIKRRIIVEEFIEDGNGGFPIDYKFICINGKAECCLVCSGRESGHADYLPYTLDWKPKYEWVKNLNKDDDKLFPCPQNLSEMIRIAETLANGIDLVRIDLYSDGSKIWFGEMTLTPAGCIFHRWSNRALEDLAKAYYSKS